MRTPSRSAAALGDRRSLIGAADEPTASPSASASFPKSAPVVIPGPRSRMSSADGPHRLGVFPGPVAWAVRGCSQFRRAFTSRGGASRAGNSGARRQGRSLALIAGLAVIALFVAAAPASAKNFSVLEPVTQVSYNSVHAEAIVSTDSGGVFSFEVSTNGGSTWQPWATSFFFDAAEEKPLPVELTGLKGGTTYKLRFQMNEVFASPIDEFTTLPVDPPESVSISAPAKIFSSSAELSGKVKRPANTNAAFDVECHYEYVTAAQFTATGYEGAAVYPCAQNPVKEPNVEKTVTALVGCPHPTYTYFEGGCLEAATTYHVRLVAENSAPGTVVKETTFTTLPTVAKPVVLTANAATEVSYRTAQVSGSVERLAGADPALDVYCFAEYVTEAQFIATGFENANRAACEQTPIDGYGMQHPLTTAGPTPVTVKLLSLKSGVTYHLRLGAEDGGGLGTKDAPSTITTLPGGEPVGTLEPAKTIAGYDTLKFFGNLKYGLGAESELVAGAFEFAEVGTENWVGRELLTPHGTGPQLFSNEYNKEYGVTPNTEYKYRLDVTYYPPPQESFNQSFSPAEPPYPTVKTRKLETPSLTLNPVTGVTANAAHFSATVNTNAPSGGLDALGKAAYKTEWEFQCTPACSGPWSSGTVQGEEGSKAISLEALELHANTYYEVKLVAHNDFYSAETPTQTFQTPVVAPTVVAAEGASDGLGGYFLEGSVNSNNTKVTKCRFEYGTTATYPNTYEAECLPPPSGPNEVQLINVDAGSGEFQLGFRGQTTSKLAYNAQPSVVQSTLRALSKIGSNGVEVSGSPSAYKVTFSGGSLAGANVEPIKGDNDTLAGGGGGGVSVSTETEGGNLHAASIEAHLEGLTVGSTYHFRIIATSAGGTSTTVDRIFIPKLFPKAPPCPNEKLREENLSGALPECRAYEMVSSPFKVGFKASFENFSNGEGTTVRYGSGATDIAGSGSGVVGGGNYIATRTPTGWETIPNRNGPSGARQSDPLNLLFTSRIALSPDLMTELVVPTFTEVDPRHSSESLYLRYGDGHMAQASRSEVELSVLYLLFIGASNDLLHSFYQGRVQSFGYLGPGIYEFSGLGNNSYSQVDLNNAGEPATNCIFGGGGREVQSDQGESVSSDGRVLVFVSRGCHPSDGFTPKFETNQIWARVGMPGSQMSYELSESQCTRTAGEPGGVCNGPSDARYEGTTPSGSRAFFSTTQQLVNADTDETRDLYACDIPPTEVAPVGLANPCPKLTLVSGAASGADVENMVRASADGKTVYFLAKGVLASNTDALGEPAEAGKNNLYVWHQDEAHPDGQTTFIGALAESDLTSPYNSAKSQITPSGGDLLFTTASRLVPTDNDTARDVYRYDLKSGELTRISTGVSGTGGNGNFEARIIEAGPNGTGAISDDGTKIVFTTEEALSPLDGNKAPDSYLWSEGEPEGGHVKGHVSLISTGAARGGSEVITVDGSGKDIYFETPAPLGQSDVDLLNDVYDARIDGGFPNAPSTCSVATEACRPTPTPAPAAEKAPSSAQPGPGNPQPPKTCSKGKVLKNGLCVVKKPSKKKHSHKKKSHKRANSNGGGGK